MLPLGRRSEEAEAEEQRGRRQHELLPMRGAPTCHGEARAAAQPAEDEAICPLKSTTGNLQHVLADFQEDADRQQKILIGVEGKSRGPANVGREGRAKETGMVCLGKTMGEG